MKIWVVNINGKNNVVRTFFDENDYNSWLLGCDDETYNAYSDTEKYRLSATYEFLYGPNTPRNT
jgi:hypothetical protein